MPENKFELQVQQKTNELEFLPSDTVWQEVEKRIRADKKRRRFIIWFWVTGILLTGAGLLFSYSLKNKAIANQYNKQAVADKTEKVTSKNNTTTDLINKKSLPVKGGDIVSVKTQPNIPPAEVKQPVGFSLEKKKIVIVKSPSSTDEIKEELIISNGGGAVAHKKNNHNKEDAPKDNSIINRVKGTNELPIVQNNQTANKKADTDSVSIASNNIHTDALTTAIPFVSNNNIVSDSSLQQVATKGKDSLTTAIITNENKKSTTHIKKPKWEYWVNLFGGLSTTAENTLGLFNGSKSAGNIVSVTAANNFTQTVPFLRVLNPSSPGNGFYWQAGFLLKHSLKKKTAFSAGFNFLMNSNMQLVGEKVNTQAQALFDGGILTVPSYYSYGNSVSYRNQYYYLQVPLSFHWQFNKSNKLPLYWQNGLAISWLVSNHVLYYSTAGNIYYTDKSRLQKTQWVYQTVVYAKLLKQSKHPVTVGLAYNYHLNSLQKTSYGDKGHLTSFGIQLGWRIKK